MNTRISVLFLFSLSACVGPLSSRPFSPAEDQAQGYALGIPHAPPGVSYTTIGEILKRPTLFDGQWVRLRGRVADVQQRSSRRTGPVTTFALEDGGGNAVGIVMEVRAPVSEGQKVMVEGRPTLLQSATSFSVVITDARLLTSSSEDIFAPIDSQSSSERAVPSLPSAPRQSQPASGQTEGQIF